MKTLRCPVCKHELVPSAMGMLCIHCGEIRAPLPTTTDAKPLIHPEAAAATALGVTSEPVAAPQSVEPVAAETTTPAAAEPAASKVAVADTAPKKPAKRGRPKKVAALVEPPAPAAPTISDIAEATNAQLASVASGAPQIVKHADSLSVPVRVDAVVASDVPAKSRRGSLPLPGPDPEPTGSSDDEMDLDMPPDEPIAPPAVPAAVSNTNGPAEEKAAPPTHPKAAATHSKKRKRHRKHSHWFMIPILAILIAAGFGAYRSYFGYHDFEQRLTTHTSARVTGTLEFYGPDFLAAYNSKVNYDLNYNLADKQPQGSLEFDGQWAKQAVVGSVKLSGGEVGVKLANATQPVIRYKQSAFLTPLNPVWYKAKADQSLFNNICENRQPATSTQILPIANAIGGSKLHVSLLNPFAYTAGGWASYYAGEVDPAHFSDIATELTKLLPAGCDFNTFGLTAEDAADFRVHYQLWTGELSDRLVLTLEDKNVGSKLTLDSTFSDYGKAQTVKIPADAIDLNAIQADYQAALTRDITRRQNIDTLGAALDTFYGRNTRYPAALSTLVPRDIPTLPTDPLTGKSFTYQQLGGGTGYDLLASLEDTHSGNYEIHKDGK